MVAAAVGIYDPEVAEVFVGVAVGDSSRIRRPGVEGELGVAFGDRRRAAAGGDDVKIEEFGGVRRVTEGDPRPVRRPDWFDARAERSGEARPIGVLGVDLFQVRVGDLGSVGSPGRRFAVVR